jgi:type II secretion system protein H
MLFSSGSLHCRTQPARCKRPRLIAAGFTLLELMVVVIIISVVAVMAAPSMLNAQKDRRAFQAAADIAALVREARARSFGKGAAVLVRIDAPGGSAQRGKVTIRDDADPVTGNPRVGGCRGTDWTTAPIAETYQITEDDIEATGDTAVALICFAPSGRSYMITGAALSETQVPGAPSMSEALEAMALAPETFAIQVERKVSGTSTGLRRRVLLSPAGAARVVSL